MRKIYQSPQIRTKIFVSQDFLAASILDPTKDDQDITVTDEEYDGLFRVTRHHSIWDDEE